MQMANPTDPTRFKPRLQAKGTTNADVVLAALSAVHPVAAAAYSIYAASITKKTQKRIVEFVNEIAGRLEELEGNMINVQALLDDSAHAAPLFWRVLDAARKSVDERKLEILQKFFLGAIYGKNDVDLEYLAEAIADVGVLEVHLLRFFSEFDHVEYQNIFHGADGGDLKRKLGFDYKFAPEHFIGTKFLTRHPDASPDLVPIAVAKLVRCGLLDPFAFDNGAMIDGKLGLAPSKLTSLGLKLMSLLTTPRKHGVSE
jgi:hypothetical protein